MYQKTCIKIFLIIYFLYLSKHYKIINFLKKDNNLNTDEKKCYYIKIYTALYFDNLEILTLLNRNNFSLGIYPSNLGIYILDNSFTKHFTNISYIDFITRYKPYLRSFFLSIKDLNNKVINALSGIDGMNANTRELFVKMLFSSTS